MKVGISAEFLGTKMNGTATYTSNLLRGLAGIEGDQNTYRVYVSSSHAYRLIPGSDRLIPRRVRPYSAWIRLPITLPGELLLHPVDVLHAQGWAPPWSPCPLVTTIHDLSWESNPQIVGTALRWRLSVLVRRSAERSERVIASSMHTANDLMRIYGVPREKIETIHPAFDPSVMSHAWSAGERSRVRERYALPSPYVLYVGSIEPRKNVDALIRAFAALKLEKTIPHSLVIAGRPLRFAEATLQLPTVLGVERDIRFLGPVPEDDLGGLYGGAAAFAFLGSCEGWGYPPLEAMASGVPTMVANKTSLPEVVGDAALLVDPFDDVGVREALLRLLEDEGLRSELRIRGLARAGQFDPLATSKRVVAVYERSAGAPARRTSTLRAGDDRA